MKKNKVKLDKKQFPEQVVETQIEQAEVTEEEQKKGFIAWISKHRKGVAITATGVALFLFLAAMKEPKNVQKNEEELPENPKYEEIENESDAVEEKIEPEVTPEKRMCMCVESTEDCPCDDDELGCTCTELEHEENCLANVIVVEETKTSAEEENIEVDKKETEKKETKTPEKKEEKKKEEIKHVHAFEKWVSINDELEQRTCACGKTETREHQYADEKTTYSYVENGKHQEITASKCINCGHEKKNVVLDDCKDVILKFDEKYEYVKCDECGHEEKIEHVLDKGKTKADGSTEYKCIHAECEYTKTVEASKNNQPKDEEKDEESKNPSGPSGSTGTNPTGPSTDPTGPSTDPTGPSTDPTGPSTDPTGPSTDPTGPSTDPTGPSTEDDSDRDFSDPDGQGNQNNEDAGNTDKEEGFEPEEDENEEENQASDTSVQEPSQEEHSTVETELQTLYAMREIVISGTTLEYSVKVRPQLESQQYTMKK